MAFSTLVAAFSLIVTQFQSISNFAAALARLSSMVEAIEHSQTSMGSAIEIVEAKGRLAYERLTLLSSANGSPLLRDLSISIPSGTRVLVTGSNQAARAVLLRATAGIWTAGAGRILRPGADDIFFLAQRPYLPPLGLSVARRRCRGRGPRCVGPGEKEHACGAETRAQAFEEIWLCPRQTRHG